MSGYINHCCSVSNIWLFSGYFQDILFIFDFHQISHDVPKYSFICINPSLCLLRFLNLWINISHQIWEILDFSFFPFLFSIFSLLLRFLLHIYQTSWYCPVGFWDSFLLPFSLSWLFILDNFCWSILKFTGSLLCYLLYVTNPINEKF